MVVISIVNWYDLQIAELNATVSVFPVSNSLRMLLQRPPPPPSSPFMAKPSASQASPIQLVATVPNPEATPVAVKPVVAQKIVDTSKFPILTLDLLPVVISPAMLAAYLFTTRDPLTLSTRALPSLNDAADAIRRCPSVELNTNIFWRVGGSKFGTVCDEDPITGGFYVYQSGVPPGRPAPILHFGMK